MATFKKFEEIECWKRSRELTRRIYEVTNRPAFARDFGLKDQIRRASVSVMSNIAEGYDRSGTAEFVHFLAIAKGWPRKLVLNSTLHWTRVTFKKTSSLNSTAWHPKRGTWLPV